MLNINVLIYFVEIVVFILFFLIYSVVCLLKKKRVIPKVFGIGFLALFLTLIGTFLLERPSMDFKNVGVIEVKSGEKLKVPNTFYHFQNIDDKVKIVGYIDYNEIGEYDIVFEVDTFTGKYSKKHVAKVVDTKAPEISLEQGEEFNQSYSKEYQEPGFKAIDLYDGDITSNVKTEKQEIDDTHFNIKYTVSDSSGNKSEKIRKVTIVDDVPPEITLNGIETMYVSPNTPYEEKGATAIDEKDGDLSDKIVTEGTVDTSVEGEYVITYKVSDSKGNEATKQRKVIVQTLVAIQAQDGTNGGKGVIYLTFDDGPSSNITPQILDILKEKNVKATFFILNYNSVGEDLVKREVAEGHTVGIHGYSHDYKQIYQSETAYMNNITSLQQKILASTGYNSTITRFPGGSSNTVSKFNPGIMTRLCKLVLDSGYKYFDWNVSSGDAGGVTDSEQLYQNVINGLSKSRANVVLMHDFSSNTKVVEALPRIIDYGIQNGYTFSNITMSTPMVTHSPNN
ncbi:MAG: DUF5011 domain-containing protein [Clostridia bacterium]|nr:DUF5011 domain-containing protein [Clostridia bacterium]